MGQLVVGPDHVSGDVYNIVMAAAQRTEVRQAVWQLYDDLREQIRRRGPICDLSGRCCRFEEYDHRLYITTAELATFVHDLRLRPGSEKLLPPVLTWDGTGCPYQQDGLCGVHDIRPLGCRLFFCDPSAEQWMNDQYEQFHADLKRLHERLGVPYLYMEWRQALEAVGLT